MFNTTTYRLTGITPLLMHNGRLADPLDEAAIALAKLTKKKGKTAADHRAVARCEWEGGLYLNADGGPILPAEVIEAALVEGAKRFKLGKMAKGGLFVRDDAPLDYDGPSGIEAMWDSGSHLKRCGVRIGQQRVARSRPIFPVWGATISIGWNPSEVADIGQLDDIVNSAGLAGVGDWRPRFGRFTVERTK